MRTDSETNHEQSDGQKPHFLRNTKRLAYAFDVGRDDGAVESDRETHERYDHRAPPFLPFRPVLWVLGIVRYECYELERRKFFLLRVQV